MSELRPDEAHCKKCGAPVRFGNVNTGKAYTVGIALDAEKRAQRAEEIAERLRHERDAETARAEFWAKEHKATKQELTTTKGQLTKTKKRLAGGVCPCCNRSFVSLAKHMASQHPDYQES